MTEKINIMISSVIDGLKAERSAIRDCFINIPFVQLIGASPYNDTASPTSSAHATIEMAKTCDLYVLILSERYGTEIRGGMSATEAEFNAAIKADPTKIIVFRRKNDIIIEEKQKQFIEKVSNYYSGYFRSSFEHPNELKELVFNSFTAWLVDRAQLGRKINYLDHFIIAAKQILPLEDIKVYYRVTEELVELEYLIAGTRQIIHFSNIKIANDFWGSINELHLQCQEWARG
ncbi:MAG: DUF4062 domain-containing protein [Methanosarcina barkeri]|nr:DUF4062 domain-containing protein [Methanosarcina sp. ERenArc_MAG2]